MCAKALGMEPLWSQKRKGPKRAGHVRFAPRGEIASLLGYVRSVPPTADSTCTSWVVISSLNAWHDLHGRVRWQSTSGARYSHGTSSWVFLVRRVDGTGPGNVAISHAIGNRRSCSTA